MFQKIRLDFWGVAAENFLEQRNIRKGTPGRHVLNGDSDLNRNVCPVNEIKVVFKFVFVFSGGVGRESALLLWETRYRKWFGCQFALGTKSSIKLLCDCCYRLVKTVQSVASVEGKCLLISVPSVNILPVWTRIRTIVKNVEYAGRSRETSF